MFDLREVLKKGWGFRLFRDWWRYFWWCSGSEARSVRYLASGKPWEDLSFLITDYALSSFCPKIYSAVFFLAFKSIWQGEAFPFDIEDDWWYQYRIHFQIFASFHCYCWQQPVSWPQTEYRSTLMSQWTNWSVYRCPKGPVHDFTQTKFCL